MFTGHIITVMLYIYVILFCECSPSLSLSDVFLADGSRVSVATVASTAIAAAQWAVTQVHTAQGNGLINSIKTRMQEMVNSRIFN